MATKLKLVSELYSETIDRVTNDSDNWQSFLKCASMNYKYNFSEQLLIYAQKPNAIACADIDTWNKVLKRWVNKGAKGIALLDDNNGYLKLRYVFDVSDTNSKYGKQISLWKVDRKYENDIIESLENKYGELTKKGTLPEALISVAVNLTDDNYNDYFNNLLKNKNGTKLDYIEDYLLDEMYKDLLANSIGYVLVNRCGIDPQPYFDYEDFIDISNFNHINTLTGLGSAVSDISEMGLREIYNTLKNIKINEIEKNRTFASDENIVYDNGTKEEIIERRENYEHPIQENRELRTSESTIEGGESQSRQVFNDEASILERTRQESISNTDDERSINRTFNGDREHSTVESITDNERNDERRKSERRIEDERSNEMGGLDEQYQELSRGSSNSGIDLQLNIYNPLKGKRYVVLDRQINQILSTTTHLKKSNEEIKEYFKSEKDINKRLEYLKEIFNSDYTDVIVDDQTFGYKTFNNGILFWNGVFDTRDTETFVSWEDLTYHYDSMILLKQLDKRNNDSIIDIEFTNEFIDKYLTNINSQRRFDIYKYFQNNSLTDDRTNYLKNLYGIGGATYIIKGSGIGMNYDSKGITFNRGYFGTSAVSKLFKWDYIVQKIKTLIQEEKYISSEELKSLMGDEEYNYKYKVGDKVSIGLDEYEIQSIDEFDVELYDSNYPLFTKVMNKVEFETKLKENPANEHLRVEKEIAEVDTIKDRKFTDAELEDIEQAKKVLSLLAGKEENKKYQNTNKRESSQLSLFAGKEQELADKILDVLNSFDTKWKNNLVISDIELKKWDHVSSKNRNLSIVIKSNKYSDFDDNSFTQFNVDKTDETILRNGLEKNKFIQHLYKDKDFSIYISPTLIHVYYDNFDFKDVDLSIDTKEVLEIKNSDVKEEIIDELEKTITPIVEKKKSRNLDNYILHPEIPYKERINYKIKNDDLGVGAPKERFRNNIEAIKTLKKCEEENRYATSEEQEILAKYVGWGGLSQAFDKNIEAWANEYKELKEILTENEYSKARDTTLNAFYTPPIVIRSMYKALSNMGFEKGNILEPSCGIGNFIGMLPNNDNLKIYGVEIDDISGRIARQLYQKSSIAIKGFEKTNYSDSFFDVAIGNVPFGESPLYDKRYDKYHFLIHDYFFAKALDKVRPGGVIAFITSKGTMDKENSNARKYLAQRANLIGAIRLPNNTFKKSAGTTVTTDILFLQKRDSITDIEPNWVKLDVNEDGIKINSYFVEHPEMILGKMDMISGQFGRLESACLPLEDENLEDLLEDAISNIHAEIKEYELEDLGEDEDLSIEADLDVKNFSYTVIEDKIYYRENSRMYPQELALTANNRIKGLIEIRDCVRELINLQLEDCLEEEIQSQQKKLNQLYDNFIKKYGLINSRGNATVFSNDSSYFLLCSLEILNENKELERKADIFYKRTIKPSKGIDKVETSGEALVLSISEKARVDLDYMSSVSNIPVDRLIEELKEVIFKDPETQNWVTADEYLSGNVREKLKIAEEYSKLDSSYDINVKSLKEVIPKDISTSEISVRLGATWIPPKYYEQFLHEVFESSYYGREYVKIHYSELTGEWNIEGKSYDRNSVKVKNTYGVIGADGYRIFDDCLNLRDTKIFNYEITEDGKREAILDKKRTAIAQAKQEKLRNDFKEWIWKDPIRREELTTLYNKIFNSIRRREYDGSHITFVGMNPEIKLRKHQINAIARILYGGNTLLAHEVGAGKTFEMVAAAMESKRLGLCNKSLFVVPNHIIEQFASEFLQLYPSANILVSTKKDFETSNRKKFCSRIATGDYDAIIIGHSQFEKIPMSLNRQEQILRQQLKEIMEGVEELKKNGGERFSIKQMVKTQKNIEKKLEKLNSQDKKDDVITFEELGVDRLFIDEAHYYKNLYLYTKMRNVGGISQTEAQKSSDLQMKCRYLDEITGSKGVIFATGTPISNSMVELYTMQRYLQYDTLLKNNLQHFDAWASTFGETITAIELAPEGSGYRSKTRFAKFYNLPELMTMFKEIADIQTADTLNLPVPTAHYNNIVVKPSEIQLDFVKSFSERAEKVRRKEIPTNEDNMLKITNDGRKLALDQRLVDAILPDSVDSKVDICSQNVYKIWEDTKADRLTQLVFCDLSTPKNDGTFNVYDDLKNKLMSRGIPEDEIEFIHNANTETRKKELFSKVRKGQVRVLIGSTQKMGAGTNCQDKLIALHDLDCPWRPSDLTQRSGRIVRQGNKNSDVYIYRYVTEKTFDAYLYQLVENKQKFIAQIMTSKTPVRSAEDIDEVALSYAEIKALAAGNPLIIEKTELDTQVSKLKLLKQSHLNEIYKLEDEIRKEYPKRIKWLEQDIENYRDDIKTLEENTHNNDEEFSPMIVNNVEYSNKKDAGNALTEEILKYFSPNVKLIGEYRGFKMEVKYDTFFKLHRMYLKNKGEHIVDLGNSPSGNITRIDNVLSSFEETLNKRVEELEDTRIQLEKAKDEVKKPFLQEQELKEKSKRLDELNILLNLNEKTNEIIDDKEKLENNNSQIYKNDYER